MPHLLHGVARLIVPQDLKGLGVVGGDLTTANHGLKSYCRTMTDQHQERHRYHHTITIGPSTVTPPSNAPTSFILDPNGSGWRVV